jgi:hypothetical protein
MMLPAVPPGLVASIVESLPARLARRLDVTIAAARTWPVLTTDAGVAITVDDQTTVTLAATVASIADIGCTCLLAPRCLHLAAAVSITPTPAPEDSAPTVAPVDRGNQRPVTEAEVAAAEAIWDAVAAILITGVPGAGAVAQATLLRAAHQARALSLYRAATAATRIVEHVRAHRRDEPAFRLGELIDDLREALTVAHGLRSGRPLHGSAQRSYQRAGNAHLIGMFCEPVLTASGYAGAVTHLADATGRIWQVANILPGDDDSVSMRADSPITVGDARATPRKLGRTGLLTMDLRATADGRVSTGRSVRAVTAGGADWYEPPLASLWDQPWDSQVNRYREALALPPADRPGGYDFLFMDATVCGGNRDGIIVDTTTTTLTVIAPHDSPKLRYVDNLWLLGSSTGAVVRMIARATATRHVAALAITARWLPERFGGHVDLGLDTLTRADLPAPEPVPPVSVGHVEQPPLYLLARRVERAVESGRSVTAGDRRDSERMRSAAMPTAAQLVEALDAACQVSRDVFGRATPGSADAFARAWLEAAVYVNAVTISAAFS